MLLIPITASPAQNFNVTLAGQACTVRLYQKTPGLFMDLTVNGAPVLAGRICQDRNYLIRDGYLGFAGNLSFFDTQGASDPVYSGLGSRFLLAYLP